MLKKITQFTIFVSILWALGVAAYFMLNAPIADFRNIRLEETFALTALFFLYFSVLAHPIYSLFGRYKWAQAYKGLQKTLVGITFGFGLIHFSIAFFFLLGGFSGLAFLSSRFILGITLSFTSLLILLFILVRFKKHLWLNLLYIVGVLITIHALLLGSHFIILSDLIPRIFFVALALFLLIQAAALDKWVRSKYRWPQAGISFIVMVALVSAGTSYYFSPQSALPSTSIHAAHLAALAAANASGERYTVSFSAIPEHPKANQNVRLSFKVYNANTGTEVTKFDTIYDKLIHLVIVDSSLKFFNHIHPENNGSTFSITTQFPHEGVYHLYTNFHPTGGAEQQVGFTLLVGNAETNISPVPVDSLLTKSFGNYQVNLATADGLPFNAQAMGDGTQTLIFDFKNNETNQPISDLQPYLGAFGHLVLINEQTYEYIHVHPVASDNPNFGGPQVRFLPASLYTTIKPGIYRVFGQFKHNDEVFVTDFTIQIN